MKEILESSIRRQLVEIAKGLNGTGLLGFIKADVRNYAASFLLVSDKNDAEQSDVQCINQMLGPAAEIRRVEMSSMSEMLTVVREHIGWQGDGGAHPNRTYQMSKDFDSDAENLFRDLKELFVDHSKVVSFLLDSGHPFYPVFWDFAFLIRKSESSYVFIGSSSD